MSLANPTECVPWFGQEEQYWYSLALLFLYRLFPFLIKQLLTVQTIVSLTLVKLGPLCVCSQECWICFCMMHSYTSEVHIWITWPHGGTSCITLSHVTQILPRGREPIMWVTSMWSNPTIWSFYQCESWQHEIKPTKVAHTAWLYLWKVFWRTSSLCIKLSFIWERLWFSFWFLS